MLKFRFQIFQILVFTLFIFIITIVLPSCGGSSGSDSHESEPSNTNASAPSLPSEASEYLAEIDALSDSLVGEELAFFKEHLSRYTQLVEAWYSAGGQNDKEHHNFQIIMGDQLDNFRAMKTFYDEMNQDELSKDKALNYLQKKFTIWEKVYDRIKLESSNLVNDMSNAKRRFAMYSALDRYKEFKKVKRGR